MDRPIVTALDQVLATWEPSAPMKDLEYNLTGEQQTGIIHYVPSEMDQIYLRCDIMVQALNDPNAMGAYDRLTDTVFMPPIWNVFKHADDLLITLAHEAIHWTGHLTRLNRMKGVFKTASGWSKPYCLEEATAQIGALMLLDTLGLASPRHVTLTQEYTFYFIRYGWASPKARTSALRRAIVLAQHAANYLLRKAGFHAKAYRVYRENGLRENYCDSVIEGDIVQELVPDQIRAATV